MVSSLTSPDPLNEEPSTETSADSNFRIRGDSQLYKESVYALHAKSGTHCGPENSFLTLSGNSA